MSIEHYEDGLDQGDNEPGFSGANSDTLRVTAHRLILNREVVLESDGPEKDPEKLTSYRRDIDASKFGSAHTGGFNMAFCDGSVKMIQFDVDPDLHRLQGNRSDGVALPQ